MIPGSNLLNMALSVIAPATVQYYAYVSRETNGIGLIVTTYADPVNVVGSLQPVPRALYQQLGLDLRKNYYMFYSSQAIADVTRDRTSDQLGFMDKRFQVDSSNDWYAIDGWNGVLCIEIPTPTEVEP